MTPDPPSAARRHLAAAFVLLLVAALPIVMLAWGRMGGRPASQLLPAARTPDDAPDAFDLQKVTWAGDLTEDDASYLIGRFLDAMARLTGKAAPEGEDAPEPTAAADQPAGALAFVTVWGPGAPAVRAIVREATLARGMDAAAGQVRARAPTTPDPQELRVRIDVLTGADTFHVAKRIGFAESIIGEPFGVAARLRGQLQYFLAPDISDYYAADNAGMMRFLYRQQDMDAAAWRLPDATMWRLKTVGFVNNAPGGRLALPSPRGLTPVDETTLPRLLRAGRLAGRYLTGVQRETGTFLSHWNPASMLRTGCDSVSEQAAAAGALAVLCALRPDEKNLDACHTTLSYLMKLTDTDPSGKPMAFTRRQEACKVVWELEASARLLEALCLYRRASGLTEPDHWITALAEFLLFMQRDDGRFELRYDQKTSARTTPKAGVAQVVPQAVAAAALARAYGALQMGRYLAGTERAIERLLADANDRQTPYTAREARWLITALAAANDYLPNPEYAAWAALLAAERRDLQLRPEDAPAADLVGGTLSSWPPMARDTADDLVVFATACMMDPRGSAENRTAARRSARYLMGLQVLPENGYYLPTEDAVGGFREQIGNNVIRLRTVESALRGLVLLAQLELQDTASDD